MHILIADDDAASRRLLEVTLARWGYATMSAVDGWDAWQRLKEADAPRIAVLDWMMPGITGIELCARVRATPALASMYLLLLTGKGEREDLIAGLEAGADDYLTKPFDAPELRARIRVGERVVKLERAVDARLQELETALARVKRLEGMISICAYCKKIRTEETAWEQVEQYLGQHAGARFSHGICPECAKRRG